VHDSPPAAASPFNASAYNGSARLPAAHLRTATEGTIACSLFAVHCSSRLLRFSPERTPTLVHSSLLTCSASNVFLPWRMRETVIGRQ
jgi:hypothetical protein